MNKSEARNEIKLIKKELDQLISKKSGRRKRIPSSLYSKILGLLEHYSQKELGDKLGIRADTISRAKIKKIKPIIKKQKMIESPKFVKVEQKESGLSLTKGKVILEIVTNSGTRVTLFE